MTTEDDFQRALDAKPDDWQTRLVFADWLQERADPRAEGYRALGVLKLCPFGTDDFWWWTTIASEHCPKEGVYGNGCTLPRDWFKLVDIEPASTLFKPVGCGADQKNTRRKIEDAAALAFGKLSEARRVRLLKPRKPRDTKKR
jgi:uncharacterized protein (TIGR02996 family)